MLTKRFLLIVALIAALALVGAACGSDSASQNGTGDQGSTTTTEASDLPGTTDDVDQDPIVAGQCTEEEPDCQDTGVIDDETPPGIEEGEPIPGPPGKGGLTIAEALTTDATGILAVRGHLFIENDAAVFCERLIGTGEGFACDGKSIPLANVDLDSIEDVVHQGGSTYTEDEISIYGDIVDGTLEIAHNVIS